MDMKETVVFRNEKELLNDNNFNKHLLQKIAQVINSEDTEKATILIAAYESYKNNDLETIFPVDIEFLHYLKAKNFVKEQNYHLAITQINKAIDINKTFNNELADIYATDHYNLKGQIQFIQGDYNQAIKSFTFVQDSPACYCELKSEMEGLILELEGLIKK